MEDLCKASTPEGLTEVTHPLLRSWLPPHVLPALKTVNVIFASVSKENLLLGFSSESGQLCLSLWSLQIGPRSSILHRCCQVLNSLAACREHSLSRFSLNPSVQEALNAPTSRPRG